MQISGSATDVASLRATTLRRGGSVFFCLASALTLLVAVPACYTFSSASGGLPRNLKTVAVIPFDNETASPELQTEMIELLRKAMSDRLNLREAPEERADVLVRGVFKRYDVDLPAGVSADPRQTSSTRRRLQVVIDIEILDQTTGKVLLRKDGLTREGQYAEGAEATGRKNALEGIINDVIEGTQSQW